MYYACFSLKIISWQACGIGGRPKKGIKMIEDVLIYDDQIYVIYEDGGGQWLPKSALENGCIRWKPIGKDMKGEE